MVLTYQEAVEAGAEAIDSHEESTSHGDETRCDTCGEVLDGYDLTRDQASHQARAVLEAVGYVDLLVECQDAWRMFDAARAHTGKLVAEVDPDECSACAAADRLEDATDGVSRHAGWVEAMRFAHHAHADVTSNGYMSANGVLGSGPDAVIVDGDWLVRIETERDEARAALAARNVEAMVPRTAADIWALVAADIERYHALLAAAPRES